MVYVATEEPASEAVARLGGGIDFLSLGRNLLRIVTHLHITDEDVERTILAFEKHFN